MLTIFGKFNRISTINLQRIIKLIWGAAALIIVLLAFIGILAFVTENKHARSEFDKTLLANARGYAQYVMLNMSIVDRTLVSVRGQYLKRAALPSQADINTNFVGFDNLVLQVAITNAEGTVVYSSLGTPALAVSIADRPHFLAIKDKQVDQLFISEPVIGRVSKKLSLQLVRPIIAPDGKFSGAVVASMDPERLKDYFTNLDVLKNNGRLSIVGVDGIVRFRLTDTGFSASHDIKTSPTWQYLNNGASKGIFDDISGIDKVNRRNAFEKVPGFPLTVVVGKGVTETFEYFEDSWNTIIVLSCVLAVLLLSVAVATTNLIKMQRRALNLKEKNRLQLLEGENTKSRFLASISHELRTPLNSILGFSELIRDTSSDPRHSQYAGLIHKSGEHLFALINSLLDLAKIESGRMGLTFEPVEIYDLLETLVSIHKVSVGHKKIELSLSTDGVLKGALVTDRTKLVQVINSVIHNAVKFTKTGAIFVVLKPAGNSGALISVTDTGIGIAAAELKQIFERFNTVPGHLHGPAERGSGVGLSLCQELLKLMGGTIDVVSELGQGTTVSIFVPDHSVTDNKGSA